MQNGVGLAVRANVGVDVVGVDVVGEKVARTSMPVGDSVGKLVGDTVGDTVGEPVGDTVGDTVGEPVGDTVGETVGDTVGETVGDTVGETVGENVATTRNPSAPSNPGLMVSFPNVYERVKLLVVALDKPSLICSATSTASGGGLSSSGINRTTKITRIVPVQISGIGDCVGALVGASCLRARRNSPPPGEGVSAFDAAGCSSTQKSLQLKESVSVMNRISITTKPMFLSRPVIRAKDASKASTISVVSRLRYGESN